MTQDNPMTDTPEVAWAYGWYENGGTKRVLPHMPTVNQSFADDATEPFPLYTRAADDLVRQLVEAATALRGSDGSNGGRFHAMECFDAGKRLDDLLAAARAAGYGGQS